MRALVLLGLALVLAGCGDRKPFPLMVDAKPVYTNRGVAAITYGPPEFAGELAEPAGELLPKPKDVAGGE